MTSRPKTPQEVLDLVKKEDVKFLDIKFVDMPGTWQHVTKPIHQLELSSFTEGFGFDGSSIRGWQAINESDMLAVPDPTTAVIDPFIKAKTLSMACDIKDPMSGKPYGRDPRFIAKKSVEYLRSTGIADTAYFGPELEFFIFDSAHFDQGINFSTHKVESSEGLWNRGKDSPDNKGYTIRSKQGYFPVAPTDTQVDIRNDMVLELEKAGIKIETQHHEVATGGQGEIDMVFSDLVNMADNVMMYKYILKNVAARHGKTLTFMPKPLFQDNGTGMHTHFSFWKAGQPLFAGNQYAGLSEMAMYVAGGLIHHAHAILAISNPTTNSYRRLVPGYEAPVNLMISSRNRSASLRIPMYSQSPKAKRIEFRCPDASSNPYLVFAAMTCAAIDGIQKKMLPPKPLEKNLYELPPEEAAAIKTTPSSLDEALKALEADHEFLTKDGVFSPDFIHAYIDYKRVQEFDQIRLRPHPYEFVLYFDC